MACLLLPPILPPQTHTHFISSSSTNTIRRWCYLILPSLPSWLWLEVEATHKVWFSPHEFPRLYMVFSSGVPQILQAAEKGFAWILKVPVCKSARLKPDYWLVQRKLWCVLIRLQKICDFASVAPIYIYFTALFRRDYMLYVCNLIIDILK